MTQSKKVHIKIFFVQCLWQKLFHVHSTWNYVLFHTFFVQAPPLPLSYRKPDSLVSSTQSSIIGNNSTSTYLIYINTSTACQEWRFWVKFSFFFNKYHICIMYSLALISLVSFALITVIIRLTTGFILLKVNQCCSFRNCIPNFIKYFLYDSCLRCSDHILKIKKKNTIIMK